MYGTMHIHEAVCGIFKQPSVEEEVTSKVSEPVKRKKGVKFKEQPTDLSSSLLPRVKLKPLPKPEVVEASTPRQQTPPPIAVQPPSVPQQQPITITEAKPEPVVAEEPRIPSFVLPFTTRSWFNEYFDSDVSFYITLLFVRKFSCKALIKELYP